MSGIYDEWKEEIHEMSRELSKKFLLGDGGQLVREEGIKPSEPYIYILLMKITEYTS